MQNRYTNVCIDIVKIYFNYYSGRGINRGLGDVIFLYFINFFKDEHEIYDNLTKIFYKFGQISEKNSQLVVF